ncbi:MAG: glycosyl transferase group 1 [Phycisphaerales bacterium]|nr:glycosyl transferase group 1 [Phycisphaerales bacterium]MDB5357172.1 glycosyl transferase group 1 [Phycisphaerales bacterium]
MRDEVSPVDRPDVRGIRLLFITGLTGIGLGGARTEEIRLVSGAAERGCDVAMCSDVPAKELADTRHFCLDYPPGDKAAGQVARAVAEFKPELVHVVGGGVRFLTTCSAQLNGVPWAFTAHNVPPAERIFPRLHGNSRLHYAVRNALAVPNVWAWSRYVKRAGFRLAICHSETVRRRLTEIGCAADKIRVVPFGCGLPESALAPDVAEGSPFPAGAYPRIVTLAGLAHHKGQLDAVRMAARLLPDFPKLSYRLIGMSRDKTYRSFLEQTIRDLGLADHVSILHAVPDSVKFTALREADLYVQPSHEEGFCIAFLEAAMLVPRLIGTDTGAIAAMGQGDDGIRVIKPGDVDSLTRAARELLGGDPANGAVARRREALGRRYSWDAYLDAHLNAYRQMKSKSVEC